MNYWKRRASLGLWVWAQFVFERNELALFGTDSEREAHGRGGRVILSASRWDGVPSSLAAVDR